jgi:hypothetical protein
MAARGYFPGRSGQLFIVPRQGDIITRADPNLPFMHGSPWPYDTAIPLFFVGRQIKPGIYSVPAVQQDLAVTVAAALGTRMPPTATGRVLPIFAARQGAGTATSPPVPKAVAIIVLDGMRPDYFDRHASEMPTLSRLRKHSAWMTNARVNYIPTNTGVGHTTIATGADPRIHGITGNNLYDRVKRARHDTFDGWDPRALMALTLADVWQLENRGRPVIIALGTSVPASTALAGHGACQLNGVPSILAGYDERTGRWSTNRACYGPIDQLKEMVSSSLWPADGRWMGHQIDSFSGVRRSGLFPRFEADAFVRLVETSDIGKDDVADLMLVNYKAADYVGHKHGPASPELRTTLREMDTHLARMIAAIEAKVGKDYLLAMTADHGMPGEPSAASRRHIAGAIAEKLEAKFDPQEKTLVAYYEPENSQIFIDDERLRVLRLTLRDLAAFLEAEPHVFAVFTEDEVRRVAP